MSTLSSSSLPQVCDESTSWPWPLTPCTWCLYQKRHQWNQSSRHFFGSLIDSHKYRWRYHGPFFKCSVVPASRGAQIKFLPVSPDNSYRCLQVWYWITGVWMQRDNLVSQSPRPPTEKPNSGRVCFNLMALPHLSRLYKHCIPTSNQWFWTPPPPLFFEEIWPPLIWFALLASFIIFLETFGGCCLAKTLQQR